MATQNSDWLEALRETATSENFNFPVLKQIFPTVAEQYAWQTLQTSKNNLTGILTIL